MASSFTELWDRLWYNWTTWRNSGGDLVKWISPPNLDGGYDVKNVELQFCSAVVRREDGLIFENTLSCRKCYPDEEERFKHRGVMYGHYFRGYGIFGEAYDGFGRVAHRK